MTKPLSTISDIRVTREAGAPPYWEWSVGGWHGGYAFTRWGARLAARRYLRASGR
jgi:hypothetical protein